MVQGLLGYEGDSEVISFNFFTAPYLPPFFGPVAEHFSNRVLTTSQINPSIFKVFISLVTKNLICFGNYI